MHILLDKALREQIANSKYAYHPGSRVVTFPRVLLDRCLHAHRNDQGRLLSYGKGFSVEKLRVITWCLAMRIELEVDGMQVAFVAADSKKQLAGLTGIKERNGQKIISELVEDGILSPLEMQKMGEKLKGYLINDYHTAFKKEGRGFFKLPPYVFEQNEEGDYSFWELSKPALKVCFAYLSELQGHAAGSNSTVKEKTNQDLQKLIHYKSTKKQSDILREVSRFLGVEEAQEPPKKGVVSWFISVLTSLKSIYNQHAQNAKELPVVLQTAKAKAEEALEEWGVGGYTDKDLEDYTNVLLKFGPGLFEIGLRALANTWDNIKTTPVQKLWGICKTILSDNIRRQEHIIRAN